MSEPGERVGAMCSANDTTVYLFWYGVYEGQFILPDDAAGAGWVADMVGEIVWG